MIADWPRPLLFKRETHLQSLWYLINRDLTYFTGEVSSSKVSLSLGDHLKRIKSVRSQGPKIEICCSHLPGVVVSLSISLGTSRPLPPPLCLPRPARQFNFDNTELFMNFLNAPCLGDMFRGWPNLFLSWSQSRLSSYKDYPYKSYILPPD